MTTPEKSPSAPVSNRLFIRIVLLGLTLLLIVAFGFSLRWRIVHDVPQKHYMAFLINAFDYAPYKDFLSTSYPGTFLFHVAVTKLVGYGDFALRCVDISLFLVLSGFTWLIFRRFDRSVAWAAIVLFGLSYLQHGQTMPLQRDYFGFLPVVPAVFVGAFATGMKKGLRLFCVGILFGFAGIVKPHLSIGLPVLVAYMTLDRFQYRIKGSLRPFGTGVIRDGLNALAGYAVPVCVALVWLWHKGSLPYFWEMACTYMPLHLGLTGYHQTISGNARIAYLIQNYIRLGGLTLWLVPASLGLYRMLVDRENAPQDRPFILLLLALNLVYSIYPVLAGQFWPYHWMPFQYFVVVTAAFAFMPYRDPHRDASKRVFQAAAVCTFLLIAFAPLLMYTGRMLRGRSDIYNEVVRADAIARTLKARLKPGDSVQPLDWTGGSHLAMLRAKARLATPYIYDYYFYHHVSHPYIQRIRKRFIVRLQQENPRFIIDMRIKPRVSGNDTTTEFPELWAFIRGRYTAVEEGDGYVLYERNQPPG